MSAIEAIDVRKRFGPVRALDGLTLRIEEGEVFGLLGPALFAFGRRELILTS